MAVGFPRGDNKKKKKPVKDLKSGLRDTQPAGYIQLVKPFGQTLLRQPQTSLKIC